MLSKYILPLILVGGILYSCKKEKNRPVPPPTEAVFLKDIVIPNLPSPYYHFEYDQPGNIIKASFSSGLSMYDVSYNAGKISEVKNNTAANKDRLEYIYDDAGKVAVIKYSNQTGTLYRRAFFTYNATLLVKIEWEKKDGPGFLIDRTVTFVYQPDGNLLEITDYRPAINGQPEATYIDRFEQYDNKINTDGFSLFHKNDEHLLLLPAVVLQKNNPRKLIHTGTGVNFTIDYTYNYNGKNVPVQKNGTATFTNGPQAGQQFQVSAAFSYY